jgi:hypothetical protein
MPQPLKVSRQLEMQASTSKEDLFMGLRLQAAVHSSNRCLQYAGVSLTPGLTGALRPTMGGGGAGMPSSLWMVALAAHTMLQSGQS